MGGLTDRLIAVVTTAAAQSTTDKGGGGGDDGKGLTNAMAMLDAALGRCFVNFFLQVLQFSLKPR
jgi:hypothetical protein